MRVTLSNKDRRSLFDAAAEQGWETNRIARKLTVSDRSVRDWRRGVVSLSETAYEFLLKISRLPRSTFKPKIREDYAHTKKAGRKGARKRLALYGNPGTSDGRRRGGKLSLATHKKFDTGFQTLREVPTPTRSLPLAELMGIMFGDGHLAQYQATVTTSAVTDRDHAKFTSHLFSKIFGLPTSLHFQRSDNSCVVVLSSKRAVEILHSLGMPRGRKLKNSLTIPGWVRQRNSYLKAFLRGLFDTDGCVYLDTHKINGRVYRHLAWAVTSYSPTLRRDVVDSLIQFGYHPTCSRSSSVFLRRQEEVHRFFKEIDSNNKKHKERYKKLTKIIRET